MQSVLRIPKQRLSPSQKYRNAYPEHASCIAWYISSAQFFISQQSVSDSLSPLERDCLQLLAACHIGKNDNLCNNDDDALYLNIASRHLFDRGDICLPLADCISLSAEEERELHSAWQQGSQCGGEMPSRALLLPVIESREYVPHHVSGSSSQGSSASALSESESESSLLLFEGARLYPDARGSSSQRAWIEIKPKLGKMPDRCGKQTCARCTAVNASDSLHADDFWLDDTMCRYCQLQHLKLASGDISRLSEYCPLDFYNDTADLSRRDRAWRALQENPQNNYRQSTLHPAPAQPPNADQLSRLLSCLLHGQEHVGISCLWADMLDHFSGKDEDINARAPLSVCVQAGQYLLATSMADVSLVFNSSTEKWSIIDISAKSVWKFPFYCQWERKIRRTVLQGHTHVPITQPCQKSMTPHQ